MNTTKYGTMKHTMEYHIDAEIIRKAGLRLCENPAAEQFSQNTRVYEFPALENVFVMESDFYGNKMPEGSCFLAFYGRHGLVGRELRVDTLRSASVADIRKLVQDNTAG